MRLQKMETHSLQYRDLNDFNNWILSIGSGTITHGYSIDENLDPDSIIVELPEDLLINTTGNKIEALIQCTYPDLKTKFNHPEYLKDRVILATTNEIVDEINDYMLNLLPTIDKEYFSADTISQCIDTCNDANILYPTEYLNTLNANNFPCHRLRLKVGIPIMLLRNLNQSIGLCNGTRLIITNLGDNVIEAKIITGTHNGETTYIPRINLTTRGSRWPLTLCRRQFPIKVCYSMTINKSQGQTLSNVGVYLKKPVFTHGQLYVAISRVRNRNGLKILIENQDGTCGKITKNIVYKEILQMV
jgi:ATP-dependent DNA helicase PIF1